MQLEDQDQLLGAKQKGAEEQEREEQEQQAPGEQQKQDQGEACACAGRSSVLRCKHAHRDLLLVSAGVEMDDDFEGGLEDVQQDEQQSGVEGLPAHTDCC